MKTAKEYVNENYNFDKHGLAECSDVYIMKSHEDFSSLQNKELIEENEVLKTVLLSSKVALKFMWDEMGKPHTPDHFNVPANAISNIDDLLSALSYKEEGHG